MKKINKVTMISIIIIIILVIIISVMIFCKIRKNVKKTVETDGQAIEEENILEAEIEENQIEEETNPVDENVIDENAIKESKVENEKEVKDNKNKYYVKVNNQANVVTIYTKDSEGNYTVPVKAMVCSIGTATPTSGKYKLNGTRYKWHTLFGHTPGTYVYGQYSTAIVGNILFHSVPYTTKGDPSTLEYLEYDKLGTKASAGCIRLTVQDAAWIYNNIATGTIVEFYYDSNPGPLGKPSAPKISGNVTCRGWDPTDPNPTSPWRNNNNASNTVKTEETNSNKHNQEQNKPQQNQQNQDQKPQPKPEPKPDPKHENNVVENNTTDNNEIKSNIITNQIISNNTI